MSDTYDETTEYEVKFTRVVVHNRSKFLPLPVHTMTGALLNAIVAQEGADVVDTAEPR